MGRFALEIGAALRRARGARDLTLRQVSAISVGRFKATSVAAYERGERTISLERFIELCDLYGIPAEAMLAEILRPPNVRSGALIDLELLESARSAEASLISGFVRQISSLRREQPSEAIVLRAGDLEVFATASGKEPTELVKILGSEDVRDDETEVSPSVDS
jgi:transcriptional regulator with XRE-family HTH domain